MFNSARLYTSVIISAIIYIFPSSEEEVDTVICRRIRDWKLQSAIFEHF